MHPPDHTQNLIYYIMDCFLCRYRQNRLNLSARDQKQMICESIHKMKTLLIENEDKDLNSLSYDRLKIAGKEERISKESQ